tara:strand:+ start:16 stop:348 length:333 start_codon:yes stop_codon:yes gene_type:complete
MPQNIPIPTGARDKYNVVLGAASYDIEFKFNTRDGRWYFDLYREGGTPVKLGVKIMENQSLLLRYSLDNFLGDIVCMRMANRSSSGVGRDNLGVGEDYSLLYFSESELED